MPHESDFKPEWTIDKTFEQGQVLVTVQKSNHRFARYRIEVSFKGAHSPVRSYQPRGERKHGKITIEHLADVVRRLFDEAEQYVEGMLQYAEDERIDRDINSASFAGKGQRPGLKTLGKMDKAKREAREKTG